MGRTIVWSILLLQLTALPSAIASVALLPPSQDPFYTPPYDLDSYLPGQTIRARRVGADLTGEFGKTLTKLALNETYQYLYRTTNGLGEAAAAVTTLLIPENADPSKLLVYQAAYDTANNDCSPSYALRAGAKAELPNDIVFIAAALDKGWHVLVPDHEGLHAAFTSGLTSGYATLDSVRTVLSQSPVNGLSESVRYAMWGYSGGALASEWAAELQPSYAPELEFVGAALGGLTPNITNVVLTINKHYFAGVAFSGMYGMSNAYPNMSSFIYDNLIPSKREDFYRIAGGCSAQNSKRGKDKNIFSYFVNGESILSAPIPSTVLATDGLMGNHGVPNIPLFIHEADGDEVGPIEDTDQLVSQFCSEGAIIEYQRNKFGDHISEALIGAPSAMAWLANRLDGIPMSESKCITKSVYLTPWNFRATEEFGDEFGAILKSLLGGYLGSWFAVR